MNSSTSDDTDAFLSAERKDREGDLISLLRDLQYREGEYDLGLFDYVWAGRVRVFPFFWNLRETPVFSWHEGSIYRHLEEYDATEIAQALVDRVYSGHILLADAEAVVPEPIRWSAWVSPLSRFASRMGPRGAGFSDNAEPRKGHGGL